MGKQPVEVTPEAATALYSLNEIQALCGLPYPGLSAAIKMGLLPCTYEACDCPKVSRSKEPKHKNHKKVRLEDVYRAFGIRELSPQAILQNIAQRHGARQRTGK